VKVGRCASRTASLTPAQPCRASKDKCALYLASSQTTRSPPRRPTSGASAPIDATLPCQRRGRRASPRPGGRRPSCGASRPANARTQASHTADTSRSQASPSSARAPPRPRSSATQPIASRALATYGSRTRSRAKAGRRWRPVPTSACIARTLSVRLRPTPIVAKGCKSSARRARVQRTAAIGSGSSARSENSQGNEVHCPVGTLRVAHSPQSTRPRGLARTSRRGTNVARRRERKSSSRRMTGPAISHDGTSRADPGTNVPPSSVGATENPTADRTSPNALQRNRGVTRTPATTRRLAGATSGTAPDTSCRPQQHVQAPVGVHLGMETKALDRASIRAEEWVDPAFPLGLDERPRDSHGSTLVCRLQQWARGRRLGPSSGSGSAAGGPSLRQATPRR
jgi:hypothetical protein